MDYTRTNPLTYTHRDSGLLSGGIQFVLMDKWIGARRPYQSRKELIEKQNTVEEYLSTNVLVKWSAWLYVYFFDYTVVW